MTQLKLNIKDLIGTQNAILQKFGNQVFKVASDALKEGKQVVLDFNGITNLTSGFCNSSIGQLYSTFNGTADKNLFIKNIDKSSIWYEKVQDAIDLANNPEKAKFIDEAILALFE